MTAPIDALESNRCHCAVDALGPVCHYVVVRKDLPLGVIAAQVVHAAGESSPGNLPEGTYAVVLAARDEAHLTEIAACLTRRGVPFVSVRESDPPYAGALMALGLVPNRKEVLRRHVSSIALLR